MMMRSVLRLKTKIIRFTSNDENMQCVQCAEWVLGLGIGTELLGYVMRFWALDLTLMQHSGRVRAPGQGVPCRRAQNVGRLHCLGLQDMGFVVIF